MHFARNLCILVAIIVELVIADTIAYTNPLVPRRNLGSAGGNGKIVFAYGYNTSPTDIIDIYDVATGLWTHTNYGTSRFHVEGAYADGYMLFGGGETAGGTFTDEVTIYDTVTNSFSASSFVYGRYLYSAVGNGQRILLGGGTNGPGLFSRVDVYCTNNGSWVLSAYPSVSPRTRSGAAAAGNKVLFAGGAGQYIVATVDIYNVETDSWEAVAQLSKSRFALGAAGAGDIAVFAGGKDSQLKWSSVVDIYNDSDGTWSINVLPHARAYLGGSANAGSNLFFFGGGELAASSWSNALDIYDAASGGWDSTLLCESREGVAAASAKNTTIFGGGEKTVVYGYAEVIVSNSECRPRYMVGVSTGNEMYFIGGFSGAVDHQITYSRMDIYHPSDDIWTLSALAQPRREFSAAYFDGYLYIGGGRYEENGNLSDSVTILGVNGQIKPEKSLNTARTFTVAAATGGILMIAGGYPSTATVDIFNLETNTQTVAALSVARYFAAAAGAGDVIIVAGGTSGSSYYSTVDIYNVVTESWSVDSLQSSRCFLVGVAAGNLVFFAGGRSSSTYYTDVDIFDVTTMNKSITSLQAARAYFAGAATSNGLFVAFGGGLSIAGYLDSVEIYDIVNGTWSYETLSVPSFYLSAAAADDVFVFMAGYVSSTEAVCGIDKFYVTIPSSGATLHLGWPYGVLFTLMGTPATLFTLILVALVLW